MSANISNLQVFLSGGAANSDPAKSLGGPISATRLLSQTATGISTITGVTVDDAAGNTAGTGTLAFNFSAKTLTWTPPGGSAGTAVDVSVSGSYAIQGASNSGLLDVTVVSGSLPGSNQSNTLTVANQTNKAWSDIAKATSQAGQTAYRCFYLKNTHSTDSMIDVRLWLASDSAGQDVIVVDVDPAGIGDGRTSGVAAGALDATKAITAASWSGGVATFTSNGHGYANGDPLKISSVSPSGYNVTGHATGCTTDTFALAIGSDPGSYSSGGTVAKYVETDAPSGVTFTANAISEAASLVIGTLAAGQAIAFWEKRIVPPNTTTSTPADTSRLGLRAYV